MSCIVEESRGEQVENIHRGAYALVNSQGEIIESCGEIQTPIYPRSAVKLFQALPLVESEADASDEEVALACSSHYGEKIHTEAVTTWLDRLGLSVSDLECGAHRPHSTSRTKDLIKEGQTYSALHNSCSGKHTGFLATCLATGDATKGYINRDHPAQQRVENAVGDWCQVDTSKMPMGIDGCGIPNLAIPLYNLAWGMAQFAASDSPAAHRIQNAIRRHPELLSGQGTVDTEIVKITHGCIITKVGAAGVHMATLPEKSLGLAIKMEAGSNPAAELVMLDALYRHKLISEAEYQKLKPTRPIRSHAGRQVGEMRVSER